MLGDMVHGGRLAVEGGLGQWMDVSRRGGGMGFRLREDTGREGRGWLWGSDRFFTSLRYVQNDMGGVLRSEGHVEGAELRMTCGVR